MTILAYFLYCLHGLSQKYGYRHYEPMTSFISNSKSPGNQILQFFFLKKMVRALNSVSYVPLSSSKFFRHQVLYYVNNVKLTIRNTLPKISNSLSNVSIE